MAITHVALDDSKRVIVAGILRADATQPELREILNEPRQVGSRRSSIGQFVDQCGFDPWVLGRRGAVAAVTAAIT